MYLDVDPVNLLDPIRLFAVVGNPGSAAYSWNIKITLIDCTRNTELQGDHLYCTLHSTQYTVHPLLSSGGVSAVPQRGGRGVRVPELLLGPGLAIPRQHKLRRLLQTEVWLLRPPPHLRRPRGLHHEQQHRGPGEL